MSEPRPQSAALPAPSRTTLTVMAWSRATANVPGPQPAAAVLARLIERMALRLQTGALVPRKLTLESWRRPHDLPGEGDFLACLTVEAEPGADRRSFRSWLQWQHAAWQWSPAPFPGRLTALEFVVEAP